MSELRFLSFRVFVVGCVKLCWFIWATWFLSFIMGCRNFWNSSMLIEMSKLIFELHQGCRDLWKFVCACVYVCVDWDEQTVCICASTCTYFYCWFFLVYIVSDRWSCPQNVVDHSVSSLHPEYLGWWLQVFCIRNILCTLWLPVCRLHWVHQGASSHHKT